MFLKAFITAFPVIIVLDFLWIGVLAKEFYKSQIGFLLRTEPNFLAAATFYVLYISAIIIFVVFPALEKKDIIGAIMMGAFFGLVAYGTYDLTNQALTKDWPFVVTIVDMLWGTFVTAFISGFTTFLLQRLG